MRLYLLVCVVIRLHNELHSLFNTSGTTAETHVTFKKNRDDQGEVVYEIQHPDANNEPLKFEIHTYRGRRWNSDTYAAAHLLGPLAQRIRSETDDIDL